MLDFVILSVRLKTTKTFQDRVQDELEVLRFLHRCCNFMRLEGIFRLSKFNPCSRQDQFQSSVQVHGALARWLWIFYRLSVHLVVLRSTVSATENIFLNLKLTIILSNKLFSDVLYPEYPAGNLCILSLEWNNLFLKTTLQMMLKVLWIILVLFSS